ncbi:hypothetical protein B0H10DRAFT_2203892, partial [Mycena sp. CBHHK59/15]
MSGPVNFRTDAARKHPLEPDSTTPVFAPSKRLHRSHASVPTQRADKQMPLPQYSHYLTNDQKTRTLHHMLDNSGPHPIVVLATVAGNHGIVSRKKNLVISELRTHLCIWSCLVRSCYAQAAGQLSLDQGASIPPRCLLPQGNDLRSPARKHQRAQASSRHLQSVEADLRDCFSNWPQVECEDELTKIMKENRAQTTAAALAHSPCSFCNRKDLIEDVKCWSISDLDITLLQKSVDSLRVHYNQPNIESHLL